MWCWAHCTFPGTCSLPAFPITSTTSSSCWQLVCVCGGGVGRLWDWGHPRCVASASRGDSRLLAASLEHFPKRLLSPGCLELSLHRSVALDLALQQQRLRGESSRQGGCCPSLLAFRSFLEASGWIPSWEYIAATKSGLIGGDPRARQSRHGGALDDFAGGLIPRVFFFLSNFLQWTWVFWGKLNKESEERLSVLALSLGDFLRVGWQDPVASSDSCLILALVNPHPHSLFHSGHCRLVCAKLCGSQNSP